MAKEKEMILEMIKNLPDNVSGEDIMEAIFIRQKIESGLKDSENRNTITHKEAKERLTRWLK